MVVTVEKAIATWIIEKLQNIIDLYFGTDNTKGEILTRGIAVYEKSTFRTLLGYHAYRLLRERDKELQTFGRLHLSSAEMYSVTTQVNAEINVWVKAWVAFCKSNPTVVISDITGKRSKVLLWISMSEKIWQNIKLLVDNLVLEMKNKYAGYYIYPFNYNGDKEKLQTLWPNLKFITAEEIQTEIIDNLQENISSNVDLTLLSLYVEHAIDELCDINNKVVENSTTESGHSKIIKQKQQDFIDYVTQQVISDRGYLYGNLRENINTATKQGTLPKTVDFTNFMLGRANSEAYSNFYLSDDKGNVYSKKDLEEVIAINKKFIVDVITPYYEHKLEEENYVTVNNDNTGTAFGYKIPSDEQLSEVYDNLEKKAIEMADKLNKSPYSIFTQDDLADWYKTIKDYSNELAETVQVDSTFVEPLVEAVTNVLGASTGKIVAASPSSAVKNNFNSGTQNNRVTNWKRYYPEYHENTTENNRVANWKRYYGGATAKPRVGEGMVYGATRYYPYEPTDPYNTYDYAWYRYYPYDNMYFYGDYENTYSYANYRYYPHDVVEPTRVSDWKRYTPDVGKTASDFLPTYKTFSGHDMVVTVQVPISGTVSITKVIGAFQTITYSIHNEKSPVRILGDMNPKRYVFGPRMIAGSLVLTVFDRHWMRELFNEYVKIKNETERYFLMDELPVMNITISCVNEYGHNAKLALYGVTIVNEGQIMSINDVYTENTYEFFALNIDYLDKVASTLATKGNSKNANIPVEDTKKETVPSLDESNVQEEVQPPEENNDISEAVQALKRPPEVIKNYSLNIKYDNAYNAVVDDYRNEKISQDRASSKITDIEHKERTERFATWEKEVYRPKYKELLAYFKLNESDIKNADKAKEKLGDKYDEFMDILALYQQAYNEMKAFVWEEANARAHTIGFEPIGLTLSGEDPRGEPGSEVQVEPTSSTGNETSEFEDLPIVPVPFSNEVIL